ncbi:hypothetical protein EI555_016723 [Monodon monoceros]|uniref:Tubulin polyglutamylase complex subunit 2 n=1 Tax=Monodon monoceros TaxID=40151 RepID=A0A4U1ECJ5_MONMO|nr:hypothetical protein EI555_016723 [Monodon monoceros]
MEETPTPLLGSRKPHLEKLTLGVTHILESSQAVLPEDLKNFYLMTNGFHMTWNVKLDEHTIPLGSMAINSISKLTQLNQSSMYSLPNAPTLADLENDTQEAIFELDPCNLHGKVCLAYKRGNGLYGIQSERGNGFLASAENQRN